MSTDRSLSTCGIDFGTTNSTIAIVRNSRPQALAIDSDSSSPHILKSLIYASPKGKIEVGQRAVDSYLWDLEHIAALPPKIIFTGRYIKTFGPSSGGGAGPPILVPEIIEVDESGRGRLLQSLKSVLTSPNYLGTNLFGQHYTLEDLLSLLLGQLKTQAESLCQTSFDNVVLGRPVRLRGRLYQRKFGSFPPQLRRSKSRLLKGLNLNMNRSVPPLVLASILPNLKKSLFLTLAAVLSMSVSWNTPQNRYFLSLAVLLGVTWSIVI